MTIEKLKSGSYRIKQMANGITYRITVDHKPSKQEAQILLSEKMKAPITKVSGNTSFERAYQNYVDVKNNVLSPATLRGYESIHKNSPEWFLKKSIYEINNMDVQKLVNDYSKEHSPKSTRNLHALVVGVMKLSRPEFVSNAKLPQKECKQDYIPSNEDVQNILNLAKGTKFEVALLLATYGLRRGEICALKVDDLDDNNLLHITKDLVQNKEGAWEVKRCPKTDGSNRVVYIDDDVASLIRQQGGIFEGCPDSIYHKLQKLQDACGIPRFSLHKMRHFFASNSHDLGMSDETIMKLGGWKSDNILKSVYRHSREKSVDEGMQKYAEAMKSLRKAE